MKSNNIRIGVVVMSKINGKYYKITNVSIKDNMKIGAAIELLDEDAFGEERISITDKNVLAFCLVDDPEPYPVPEGYNVTGGKLMKDGKPVCEQGSVIVKIFLRHSRIICFWFAIVQQMISWTSCHTKFPWTVL